VKLLPGLLWLHWLLLHRCGSLQSHLLPLYPLLLKIGPASAAISLLTTKIRLLLWRWLLWWNGLRLLRCCLLLLWCSLLWRSLLILPLPAELRSSILRLLGCLGPSIVLRLHRPDALSTLPEVGLALLHLPWPCRLRSSVAARCSVRPIHLPTLLWSIPEIRPALLHLTGPRELPGPVAAVRTHFGTRKLSRHSMIAHHWTRSDCDCRPAVVGVVELLAIL